MTCTTLNEGAMVEDISPGVVLWEFGGRENGTYEQKKHIFSLLRHPRTSAQPTVGSKVSDVMCSTMAAPVSPRA